MQQKLKILSFVFIAIFCYSSLIQTFPVEAIHIPPTRAFEKINSGSNHIEAGSYRGPLNVTGSGGVTVSLSNGTTAPSITISGSGVAAAQGKNLGTSGTGIYSGNFNATMLQFFKLISANSNCAFSSNSTNVILSCNAGLANAITSINSQTGPAITIQNGNLHNTKITTTTNTISIDSNNTAQISNAQGSGNGLFGSRLNATANTLKSLLPGSNISMTNNSTSITINSSTWQNNTSTFTLVVFTQAASVAEAYPLGFSGTYTSGQGSGAAVQEKIDYPFTITHIRANLPVNGATTNSNLLFWANGVSHSLTLTALTTGEFDSGNLNISVPSASECYFELDSGATSAITVYANVSIK